MSTLITNNCSWSAKPGKDASLKEVHYCSSIVDRVILVYMRVVARFALGVRVGVLQMATHEIKLCCLNWILLGDVLKVNDISTHLLHDDAKSSFFNLHHVELLLHYLQFDLFGHAINIVLMVLIHALLGEIENNPPIRYGINWVLLDLLEELTPLEERFFWKSSSAMYMICSLQCDTRGGSIYA
ncbi:hypothetical protein WN943_027051 [Citrus x changshan-huyou]